MKGCLKGCLIFAGIIVLIIVVGLMYIRAHREKVINFAMEEVEKSVLGKLPEGYDEEKVKVEFDSFVQALKEGRIDEDKFQDLSTLIQEVSEDEQLSAEEMNRILRVMRESIKEREP